MSTYEPQALSRRHYSENLWLRDTLESVAREAEHMAARGRSRVPARLSEALALDQLGVAPLQVAFFELQLVGMHPLLNHGHALLVLPGPLVRVQTLLDHGHALPMLDQAAKDQAREDAHDTQDRDHHAEEAWVEKALHDPMLPPAPFPC